MRGDGSLECAWRQRSYNSRHEVKDQKSEDSDQSEKAETVPFHHPARFQQQTADASELFMSLDIISLCVSAISILSVLYFAGVKLGKLEIKVDTMWQFLLKRGAAEGVRTGLMSLNSPITITPEALALFEPMREELLDFCNKCCAGLDDAGLAMCIEKQFGERIVKEICLPNHLTLGVCIIIAVAVARNDETLHGIMK